MKMKITEEEFWKKYCTTRVKFSDYYKYTFTFEGKGPKGETVTIYVGGDIESIYRLDIEQDEEYMLSGFDPIIGATIETEEGMINVNYAKVLLAREKELNEEGIKRIR